MSRVKITLVKSLIGNDKKYRKIVDSLGLKKLNSSVEHNLDAGISGKIRKAKDFLRVEEL